MSGPGLSRAILAAQPGAPAVGVGPAAPAVAPAVAPAPPPAARHRQANPHGAIGGPPPWSCSCCSVKCQVRFTRFPVCVVDPPMPHDQGAALSHQSFGGSVLPCRFCVCHLTSLHLQTQHLKP